MAIEDGYQLAVELEKAWQESVKSRTPVDVVSSLRSYEKERKLRVAIIHGLARMAAIMATTYRPYLGTGLGPLSFLTTLRIPHPGRVGGRFFIKIGMPLMLSWVLGGNSSKLEGRPLSCRLSDKANDQLGQWFQDDDALEQAMGGEWYLFPMSSGDNSALQPIRLIRDEQRTLSIGSRPDPSNSDSSLSLSLPQISEIHATITCKNKGFYLTDLGSEHGTWFNDNEGRRYRLPPNFPVRFHPSDAIEFGSDKKAMFRVKVLSTLPYESARGGDEVLQAA
jgi:zeaxanthin epoxidase